MTATLRRSGLLVLAAATAVTLAACGSDGTADPAPTTGAASSTTTTTAVPAETTPDTDEPAAAESSETEGETGGADTGGAATGGGTGDADGGTEAQPGQEDGPDRSMHGPAEIAFLEQIDAVGVPYPDEVAAIDAGNVTCIFMERRQPYSEAVDYIQRNLRTDAGQTGAVARAGIDHFCPEQFDYAAGAEERFRTGDE